MTLDEIHNSTRSILTPADIAAVLDCDPQDIRNQAHADATALGFPVTIIGNRVKIPRLPFIKFIEGDSSDDIQK